MKLLICFTFLLMTISINNKVSAQTYCPLVVDSSNYIVEFDNTGTPFIDAFWGYQILGDTIVNGITYKKVYTLNLYTQTLYPPIGQFELLGKYVGGLIRENNKKVYFKELDSLSQWQFGCTMDTSEYLLYDFNLHVGDTINLCIQENNYITDTVIDSLYQYPVAPLNKTFTIKRKNHNIEYYLIEGVGSNFGLKQSIIIPGKMDFLCTYLYCYSRGSLSSCSIITNDHIYESDLTVKIFPNPCAEILNVSVMNLNYFPLSISIYNIHGQCIKQIISKQNINSININELPQGIYEVKIVGDNLNFNERFVRL